MPCILRQAVIEICESYKEISMFRSFLLTVRLRLLTLLLRAAPPTSPVQEALLHRHLPLQVPFQQIIPKSLHTNHRQMENLSITHYLKES